MKECKKEYAYLVRSDQGYYCHKNLFGNMKEMAARCFSGRKARMLARQVDGQIERESLTPAVLRAIIEEQPRSSLTGLSIRRVLNSIYGIPDNGYDSCMNLTLGGKRTRDSVKLLFTAACRYADIYHTAHTMIESYYNLMASMELYEYDPEIDGRGMEELEIMMQIGEMYEKQIYNLAILERDARRYLQAAFAAGNPKAADRFHAVLDLFSEKIVNEYERDPEKCFQQYVDIVGFS